jgi:hypothetical protein
MTFNELDELLDNIHYLRGVKGEDALQNEIVLNLRALTLERKLNCLWFHVPNQQIARADGRDYARIRKLHSVGLIPGAPDLVFISQDSAVLMELKSANNSQTPAQKLFEKWAGSLGVKYVVARSWKQAEIELKNNRMIL